MQNYIGLIEFDREVNCKEDILGKQINTIIGGVHVVVFTPEADKEPDPNNMLTGLGVFYNFLGLKSVCNMYSRDFIDNYDCRKFVDRLSSFLFMDIRQCMTGWITNVDNTVALYSHAVNAVAI